MVELVSLLYVSRSRLEPEARRAALEDIEYACLSNNTDLDITGILVVTKEYFTQLLEGPVDNVDAVMARIIKDPRHGDIQIVRRTPVTSRFFSNWKMARFDVGNFGETAVAPIIAATHTQPESPAAHVLGRLLVSI